MVGCIARFRRRHRSRSSFWSYCLSPELRVGCCQHSWAFLLWVLLILLLSRATCWLRLDSDYIMPMKSNIRRAKIWHCLNSLSSLDRGIALKNKQPYAHAYPHNLIPIFIVCWIPASRLWSSTKHAYLSPNYLYGFPFSSFFNVCTSKLCATFWVRRSWAAAPGGGGGGWPVPRIAFDV